MELTSEKSCCSAGNNQVDEQAGITQHRWQLSRRRQAGIVQLSWKLSSRWAGSNHAAQQALITWLSMHYSRRWSHTYHVTDHALIMWLIMHWSRGCHALITWLDIHWSRAWSCTDDVADHAFCFVFIEWSVMNMFSSIYLSSYIFYSKVSFQFFCPYITV